MGKPAARLNDQHSCPMIEGDKAHNGGPINPLASPNVNIGGSPAARQSDMCTCVGSVDTITGGSGSVNINGRPAARMGDQTAHGGIITQGCSTVNIGG